MKITYEKPHTEVIMVYPRTLMDTLHGTSINKSADDQKKPGTNTPGTDGKPDVPAGAKGWSGGVTDFDAWDD